MSLLLPTLISMRRRPGRTLLTALGTALGIATIVALLAVSGGAQRSASQLVDLGASDLGLFQKDAADPTTSILSTGLIKQFDATPGIAGATPLMLLVQDVPRSPATIVFGAPSSSFLTDRLVFSAGRMYGSGPAARNQIAIGNVLAQQLHLGVGGSLVVAHRTLRVVGIYHIGVAYQDDGAFIPMSTAQAITARPGETTTIAVKLDPGTKPAAEHTLLTKRFPGVAVIADGEEASRAGVNGLLVSKAALVIAVLALVIGGIGVFNTMLMAVIERRSEFALLSALGWSNFQVAGRVLVEGVVTTVIGAGVGLLLGVFGAHLLVNVLGAQMFVTPQVTAWALGRALLVGVLIGVLGGLYPSWRAAHVSPAHVLAQN
ncbi:MAG TPA: ABC transporter permease [Solirubrobacteraceae bacterium]|jgi:putative ABC transport system permease protein|nr:ABC transporter permease [Solirubrobacteraceae bacterium]